jgi:putative membrane protein
VTADPSARPGEGTGGPVADGIPGSGVAAGGSTGHGAADGGIPVGGVPDPDSRARTHLANERTFLAWFRTGLTLIALGLAAAQFLSRDVVAGIPVVRTLSTLLALTGMFLVLVGARRYLDGRRHIDQASFRPAYTSILVTAGAALVTGILAIGFVWLLHGG